MKDQQKYLLLGAVGLGALAYWYFFYGPGVTVAAPVTTSTSAATPASVVPAATGATVPVPVTVSQFTAGMGPTALAAWYNLVDTLPAAAIQAQYANIDALVQAGSNPSQALLNAVYSWFADYGITNVKV
jgi:hypothetical protein